MCKGIAWHAWEAQLCSENAFAHGALIFALKNKDCAYPGLTSGLALFPVLVPQELAMDRLPPEVQIAICRDALLMHMWQKQEQELRWWVGPILYVWSKIAYYERQWPGSTEVGRSGRPSVPWEP